MSQIIIHVDMDAFFAAVEIRDNPSLRGKPLIIGSLPHERGVVATASYEARKYGVHSGMNIKDAYRLCPHGIYLYPNIEKYKAVSLELHRIWNDNSDALEAIALDEAYLDLTERAGSFEGARKIAHTIKKRTLDKLGLTCSIGVAYSKTAAKTASEEKKPNGYFEIRTAEDFVRLIQNRDVRALYTVGAKTATKLNAGGIFTVRDVQQKKAEVIRLLGKQGNWITSLAFGIDGRKVIPYRPQDAKSISREITFQEDVSDYDFLKEVLFLLALCVESKVRRLQLYGHGISLKLTYTDMKSISRSRRMSAVENAMDMYAEALRLLAQVVQRPVRLIGVGIYDLTTENYQQLSLGDWLAESSAAEIPGKDDIFAALEARYGLDFAGHLTQIVHSDTLHKTVEYMRKYRAKHRENS